MISNYKSFAGKSGLTLIELLVAMAITIVAGILLVEIIVNSSGLFTQQSTKVTEGLNANDALAQIRNTIRDAGAVAASYTNGSQTFVTGSSQLVLKVPSLDSSKNVISDTYDYFIFYLDQKTLHYRIFPNALSSRQTRDQIFSTNVDSLSFLYLNTAIPPAEVAPITASKVRVTLILKQRVGLNYEINTATSEANLRNG